MRTNALRRRSLAIALVLVLASVQELFACLEICKEKFGYYQKIDGYWHELVYCEQRWNSYESSAATTTCYYRNTGTPVGGIYPE